MKHTYAALFILFAALTVLVTENPAWSEETSVGTITSVQGTATVTRSDGQKIAAQKDLNLFPGDMITTEEDGVVSFAFHDGDLFTLNTDAQVALDELSAAEEDTAPVLRLALGYLWSKIRPYLNKEARPLIHTPTAVVGVRGTEFDTVVSEDSSSTIAVDEGSIEIEAEHETLVMNQGQSTEVDLDEKIKPPEKAVPKDMRDWQKFRKEKAKKLIKHLPQNAPRMRKRFERDVNRYLRFTQKINATADRIDAHITRFYDAMNKGDRATTRKELEEIKALEAQFRPMTIQFRKAINRVKVIGRNAYHVQQVFHKHRHRFSPAELAIIEPNLSAISKKLAEVKKASVQTIATIKQTYRKIRKIRRMVQKRRQGPKRK
ncbi:FecR domain-containing protein [Thermodesulfobacteriota bacterium]